VIQLSFSYVKMICSTENTGKRVGNDSENYVWSVIGEKQASLLHTTQGTVILPHTANYTPPNNQEQPTPLCSPVLLASSLLGPSTPLDPRRNSASQDGAHSAFLPSSGLVAKDSRLFLAAWMISPVFFVPSVTISLPLRNVEKRLEGGVENEERRLETLNLYT
jgi:hypothetical protein